MSIYKLKPAMKSAIWGGRKLIDDFGKEYDGDILAETWELSAHPDGPSIIDSGNYAGISFPEFIEKEGSFVLGKNCEKFLEFPILIKLIDARDNLSVQVHPDNEYARKYEGQYGKTEMWYVVDAEPGAKLCFGCRGSISKEAFRKDAVNGNLDKDLNFVPVNKGDVFFIEAGTIHAIGSGIVIAEIQQNSNVTYRVYDYGRKDASGNQRELHIDKALDVARLEPPKTDYDFGSHIGMCDCFVTDLISVNEGSLYDDFAGDDSFVCLLVTDGDGVIKNQSDSYLIKKGDCIFIEAGSGSFNIKGELTCLLVRIP